MFVDEEDVMKAIKKGQWRHYEQKYWRWSKIFEKGACQESDNRLRFTDLDGYIHVNIQQREPV